MSDWRGDEEEADEHWFRWHQSQPRREVRELIRRARAAERERCARAVDPLHWECGECGDWAGAEAARRIRALADEDVGRR